MNKLVFNQKLEFEYNAVTQLSKLVQRVIAPNPSPFTFYGTGTYIIGENKLAIIDPGPNNEEHIQALLKAVQGRQVTHLLVTHTHLDHSPATAILQEKTGAATYGFGPHGSGQKLTSVAGEQVEEGADLLFDPDYCLKDGDTITGDGWTIEGVYTPGHTSNHMCFALKEDNSLFCGDHIMAWSTTIVSPPDGDMSSYMQSLYKVQERSESVLWPTHGDAIRNPRNYIQQLIEHRQLRERQVLECLSQEIRSIPKMVEKMYESVPSALHPAAARSVLAHIIWLVEKGEVTCKGQPGLNTVYHLCGKR